MLLEAITSVEPSGLFTTWRLVAALVWLLDWMLATASAKSGNCARKPSTAMLLLAKLAFCWVPMAEAVVTCPLPARCRPTMAMARNATLSVFVSRALTHSDERGSSLMPTAPAGLATRMSLPVAPLVPE